MAKEPKKPTTTNFMTNRFILVRALADHSLLLQATCLYIHHAQGGAGRVITGWATETNENLTVVYSPTDI